MDVALSLAIVNTASAQSNAQTSQAVQVAMLKKAMDLQEATATTMIDALVQSVPQPQLATSGALGTQLNTFA